MTARTLAWTSFIAIAAFVLMAASRLTLLDPVESTTLNVTSPMQSALSSVTRPVADWVNNITDAGALSEENRTLREENERLTNELARAREQAIQEQNAEDLNVIRQQFPEDTFLPAGVVARDSSNARNIIAIDTGSSDGVKDGMIVVSEGRSLVGTITKTFDDYAWVTLITDPKSAVSAIVQESRADGVVSGNYDGSLVMEFVEPGRRGEGRRLRRHVRRRRAVPDGRGHRARRRRADGGAGPVPGRARRPPRDAIEARAGGGADQLRADHAGEAAMRYWTGAVIAFLLAIVQASSVEQFKILGVSPNLMLVFLVAWLVVRGLDDVLPMLLVSGITLGLVGLQSPGVVLLALLPVVALGMVRELHIVHSDFVLALLLIIPATLAYETVMLASVMATGGTLDFMAGLRAAVVPAAIVNVALMPFVFGMMRFAKPADRRGQLSF